MNDDQPTPTAPVTPPTPTEPAAASVTPPADQSTAPIMPSSAPADDVTAAPVTEAPEPPAPEPPAPAPAEPTGPTVTTIKPAAEPSVEKSADGLRRILLVEDDDALAQVYITRLQAEGFDVKRTPNGEDALATAIQYKPDLVLLDVMMPKVSGFDVLDIMRNTPETANIKVIMLTALSQESDKERATKLGADDYLVKSQVVIADVVERIRHHLNIAATPQA